MKINHILLYKRILSVFMIIMFCFDTFADLKIDQYFDNLIPEKYVVGIFNSEKKNELNNNTLNYNDIEDYIHYFNPEILNNWNVWENNKSAGDIQNDYQSAADSLYDSAASQDTEWQEAMIKAQGTAMQIQADKNANDSYTNFLANYLDEKQLALQTKLHDLNYQKSSYEMKKAEASLEEAKRKETYAQNAIDYGNGTKVELLNAKKLVTDAKATLTSAKSSQKSNKRNLFINCGKPISDDIYVTPIDVFGIIDVSNIDFENDYKFALEHSVQLEIYRRKIENAKSLEVKNELKILYEAAPEKIYNDMEKKYSDILDAIETNNNGLIAVNLANETLSKAQNEYSNGNISSKELSTAKYNLEIANISYVTSFYDIKIAMEVYDFAKKGLADC